MVFLLVIRGRGTVGELSCRDFGGERPLFGGPCRPRSSPSRRAKGRETSASERKSPGRCMLLRRTPAQAGILGSVISGRIGISSWPNAEPRAFVADAAACGLEAWSMELRLLRGGQLGRAPIPGLAPCNAGPPAPSCESHTLHPTTTKRGKLSSSCKSLAARYWPLCTTTHVLPIT